MKHLKMSIYLLVTAVIFTSCEKETITIPENSEMNVQKNEIQSFKSATEMIDAGFDLNAYQALLQKKSIKNVSLVSEKIFNEESGTVFFTDKEEFFDETCDNLVLEDFESSINQSGQVMPNSLSEYTNNAIYALGDIVPNIEISSNNYFAESQGDPSYSQSNLWIPYLSNKKVSSNWFADKTVIDFSGEVKIVSFEVFRYLTSGYVEIELFSETGTLGTFILNNVGLSNSNEGTFFGAQSNIPITRIVLNSNNNGGNSYGDSELIDNLSFGICIDNDGDGVLNEDDLCANTPNGETVNSNGCAQSQLDDDNDGVMNTVDSCSNTPSGEAVNENGCGQSQLDYDGDGVMNNKDAHIYSILGGVINIGGCYPSVNNKMVKNGSTMMDQIKDLTDQINSEYNGRNYATLHSKFMTKLAQITYYWRTAKLITATQRSQISSCAWGAAIPYYNNEN